MAPASTTSPPELDWSSLPADLLRMILERLPWSSHPSFGTTCKHWGSVVSPFYPAWLTPMLFNSNAEVGTSSTRYYSPYYHKNFDLAVHLGIPNAQICCTNGHRLALSQRTDDDDDGGKMIQIVDCNMVTGVVQHMEPLEDDEEFNFVIYDDGGRKVFGVDVYGRIDITYANQNDNGQWDGWKFSQVESYDDTFFDASAVTNPVLHDGLLYILNVDGMLAVRDVRQDEEGFKVLDKPKGFGFDHCNHDRYLFESDGELMVVLIGWRGSPAHLVKLNELTMEWEKVESLEGRALFTGALTTMMVKTDVRWMKNKIFLPRLYDWPETIHAKLVEKHGELAFVPVSTCATSRQQDGPKCGSSMWSCGLKAEEFSEFWETIKLDYSIWIDFKKN